MDYNDDEYANINIYWNSHNLVHSKGELWTTGFVEYVIPYLSGGGLGNARTAPGCTYRPRVSLDSFACTFLVNSRAVTGTVLLGPATFHLKPKGPGGG